MRKIYAVLMTLALTVPTYADDSEVAFAPTWKLLGTNDKKQFIGGYQQGWKDANKIIDIAISYLETNPEEGARALRSIRSIYDLSRVSPDNLAHGIDLFYADPDNASAPLSKAVTAAINGGK